MEMTSTRRSFIWGAAALSAWPAAAAVKPGGAKGAAKKGAAKSEWRVAAVAGGFIEIKESIMIYTDAAEWSEDIDMDRVLSEKAKAEDWLTEHEDDGDPNDILKAKIMLAKALTRTNVAEGSTRHH